MSDKYAVIGHPIGHSMSPFIHKRLFGLSGKDVEYSSADIAPEDLESSIPRLSRLSGFNITIPHKEAMMKYLADTDDSAKRYGAVNCVKCENGRMSGCSTDAYGFKKALLGGGVRLLGNVLVLGCGGAARTLAREAADSGCTVTIAARSRSLAKADALAEWINSSGGKALTAPMDDIKGSFDLLINATPVGMYPNTDASPVGVELLSRCGALFDAIYNPGVTRLMESARSLGIKTVGGMPMLLWQAVAAHEFWYGASFDDRDIENLISDAEKETKVIFG